jgi:hypothetical protein
VRWHVTATDYVSSRIVAAIARRSGFGVPEIPNRFAQAGATKEHLMLDIVMLALGLGFFAAAVGYTYACERL